IKLYYEGILSVMPEKKEVNLLFMNNKDLTFSSMNAAWKLNTPTSSNGAAYEDLDNDGDLDIITNNLNDAAFIYRNNTQELNPKSNYLKIKLNGSSGNLNGIGAKITITAGGLTQTKELYLSRGFQSSVSRILHFGVGDAGAAQNLSIVWPDGKFQSIENVQVNQQITLHYTKAVDRNSSKPEEKSSIFKTVPKVTGIDFRHQENDFDDFKREGLLPYKLSQNGPALSVGDINNDGLDDFYIGGAKNQPAELFVQQADGSFSSVLKSLWEKDKNHEDIASIFFDADQDGDLDLYVVSGGNEKMELDKYYTDRFYENSDDGNFIKIEDALPAIRISGSCVKSGDMDGDGDLDLFVGGKMIPGKYPLPATSYILKNESVKGQVKFVDVTSEIAPFLSNFGMVSDAECIDLDKDEKLDLVIVGEWMQVKIIRNTGIKFIDITRESGLENQIGWWFSIASADFDHDGDLDFIVGNLGLNYKYKASPKEPFEVFASDFDNNGTLDIILGYHENGTIYPLRGRECTARQMPFINKKFSTYNAYGAADMTAVFGSDVLAKALHYRASTFATSYFENLGDFKFNVHIIEGIAQLSSVNSILIDDFNGDGNIDALLSGNLYQSEVETIRNDASFGVFLEGDGQGNFSLRFPYES
ncbi:MAG: VCBS repeat-containing protein, partial [Cyclobacteriaceae bacterium]|nr:VCBS repeat-containing protein [Cyclobacteriaceae bacterium]